MIASEVEPIPFVLKGTGQLHGFACPTCKKVYTSAFGDFDEKSEETVRDVARRCCADKECQDCGKVSGDSKYIYMYCVECRAKRDDQRRQELFEKAEKIELRKYNGEFLCWEDEFFSDVWELYDHCMEAVEEGEEPECPSFVWGCSPIKFGMDAGRIIEAACEEHHEEAYDRIDGKSFDELQVFLDSWCAKQGITSYEVDRSVAVLIPPIPEDYDIP
jgi:hypothetical protein